MKTSSVSILLGALLLAGCIGNITPTTTEVPHSTITDPVLLADEAFDRGRQLYAQGRFEEALSSFQTALRHDTLRFKAHFWSGLCHYQLGEYGLEIVEYSLCHALNRNYPPVWRNLGDAYFAMDDLEGARNAYTRFLEWEPQDAEVVLHLALIQFDLGNVSQANELCKRYEVLNTGTPRLDRKAKGLQDKIDQFLKLG